MTRLMMILVGSLLVVGQAASQVLDRTIGDVITGNNGQWYVSSDEPDYTEPPGGIQLNAVNARDFMRPGAYDELEVELSNPADSPYTITGISGWSYQPLMFPASRGSEISSLSRSPAAACPQSAFVCWPPDAFPLKPGQSVRTSLLQVWSNPVIPADNIMVTRLSFTLTLSSEGGGAEKASAPVTPFVRIVNHTGDEDRQIFDELAQSTEPLNKGGEPGLEIEILLPEQAVAGDHVPVYAQIRNTGNRILHTPQSHHFTGFGELGDELAFIQCKSDCILAGPTQLTPGDQWLFRAGTLAYQGSQLVARDFRLSRVMLSVMDSDNNSYYILPVANKTIQYGHDGEPAPNPATRLQPRSSPFMTSSGIIRDPATGYDWLPPVHSRGLTTDELDAFLDADPAYAGLVQAHAHEVEQMLRHYLNARQIEPGPLGLRNVAPADVVEGIRQWMQDMGTTDLVSTLPVVRGLVADPPRFIAGHQLRRQSLVVRVPVARKPSDSSSFWGASLLEEPALADNPMADATGYWLVHRPTAEPDLPDNRATVTPRKMTLPAVQIGSDLLNVELNLLDAFNGFWRVTSLKPAVAENALSQFDDISGTLDINDAIEINADGSTQTRSFRLTYVPESDPPVLQLQAVENAAQ